MVVDPKVIKGRLIRGAKLLGEYWRGNEGCEEGWGLTYSPENESGIVECFCEPKKKFCEARVKWCGLAALDDRVVLEGEYGLLEMLTGTEWDASGLTVKFHIPVVGVVAIGPKGAMGREDLMKLGETPEVLGSILSLMNKFPGCKVAAPVHKPNEELPVGIGVE